MPLLHKFLKILGKLLLTLHFRLALEHSTKQKTSKNWGTLCVMRVSPVFQESTPLFQLFPKSGTMLFVNSLSLENAYV